MQQQQQQQAASKAAKQQQPTKQVLGNSQAGNRQQTQHQSQKGALQSAKSQQQQQAPLVKSRVVSYSVIGRNDENAAQTLSQQGKSNDATAIIKAVVATNQRSAPAASSPGPLTSDDSLAEEERLSNNSSAGSVTATDNVHVHSEEGMSPDSFDSLTSQLQDVNLGAPLPPPTPEVLSTMFVHTEAAPSPAASQLPPVASESSVDPLSLPSMLRNSFARSLAPCQLLASEAADILAHLLEREQKFAPHPNYMSLQPELNWRMREILLDWLHGVSYRFRLKSETYALCAATLDRFLSVRECSRDKFQLVGITCLIVATKYEETHPPSIEDFIVVTDRAFSRPSILHMEGCILSSLTFELTVPTVAHFLGPVLLETPTEHLVRSMTRALQAEGAPPSARDVEAELRHWVSYIGLASVQHGGLVAFPPSLVAAATVALAHFQIEAECDALARMRSGASGSSSSLMLELHWDERQSAASGGYDRAALLEAMVELRLALEAQIEGPASGVARYNSVSKRFQREQYAAVSKRKVVYPAALAAVALASA